MRPTVHCLIVLTTILISTFQASWSQWSKVEGTGMGESYAVISSADTVIAGVGNVVFISTNGGSSWTPTARLVDTLVVSALARTPHGLVAGTLQNGIYEWAENTGWISRSAGLSGAGSLNISSLAVRDSLIYVGTFGAGVFRVPQSFSESWVPFRDGIPSNNAWNINSLTNVGGILFAGGGANANVYVNQPAEQSWREIPFAQFSPLGTSFLAAAHFNNSIHAVGSQGLHRSTDGGTTWLYYNPGLGYIDAGGFAESPAGFYAFLSKAASTTLVRLNADDSTWTKLNTSSGATFSMARSGHILFATRIDGLWRYDLSASSVSEEPHPTYTGSFSIGQNYPNPFNPSTKIQFTVVNTRLPHDGQHGGQGQSTIVKVYDVLGREVSTLVNEVKEPGTYTVQFDARLPNGQASHLSSGVYFYRIQAGDFVATRKLLLLR